MESSELQRALGRIEGTQQAIIARLDSMNGSMREHTQEDDLRFNAQEKRISNIENIETYRKGQMAVFAGGAGLLVTLLWEYIKRTFK